MLAMMVILEKVFQIHRVSSRRVVFPRETIQSYRIWLQREIDFAEGEIHSIVVGLEILQEAKRISYRGRVSEDVIFPAVPGLSKLGFAQVARKGCTTD